MKAPFVRLQKELQEDMLQSRGKYDSAGDDELLSCTVIMRINWGGNQKPLRASEVPPSSPSLALLQWFSLKSLAGNNTCPV